MDIGVKALIIYEGRLLLIKRSDKYKDTGSHNIWDTPGGRIEFGEEPEKGLKREVKEETGLDIQVERILDASTIYLTEKTHIVRITFLCTAFDDNVRLSDEHTDYIWIEPSKIDFQLKDGLLEKVIKKYL